MSVKWKGASEPELKRMLWQLVHDLGGEVTLTAADSINDHTKRRNWPTDRKLRIWWTADGRIDLMADGTPDEREDGPLPLLKDCITNLTPTSSPFMESLKR